MISPAQDRFVEWLLTPKGERTILTQEGLAIELDVTPSQLSAWKREPEFLEHWNAEHMKNIGSPEKKSKIMATLYQTATDPDDPKHVQAAEKYFAIEGSLRPAGKNTLDITVGAKDPSELTDEQLARFLASKAGDELSRRRDAV